MKKIVVILHTSGVRHEIQGKRWEVDPSTGLLSVWTQSTVVAEYPNQDWHAVYFADSVSDAMPGPRMAYQ